MTALGFLLTLGDAPNGFTFGATPIQCGDYPGITLDKTLRRIARGEGMCPSPPSRAER